MCATERRSKERRVVGGGEGQGASIVDGQPSYLVVLLWQAIARCAAPRVDDKHMQFMPLTRWTTTVENR